MGKTCKNKLKLRRIYKKKKKTEHGFVTQHTNSPINIYKKFKIASKHDV